MDATPASTVPDLRIRALGSNRPNPGGKYVLYWMTAARRGIHNFALQRAVEWASELRKPLLVMEGLQSDYPWACRRFHSFILQGMVDNATHFARTSATYWPYIEPRHGASKGLLLALAKQACAVIGDDFPCFIVPGFLERVSSRMPVHFEVVDSNGLLPLRATDRVFKRAVDFRRFLQKNLLPHLDDMPLPNPLARIQLPPLTKLPSEIKKRWPSHAPSEYLANSSLLETLPLNHTVEDGYQQGGMQAGKKRVKSFVATQFNEYDSARNQPESDVSSGLSSYLHFGHVASHQVFTAIMQRAEWTAPEVAPKATASAQGWWGLDENTEAYLDQLITWRELGYNMCWQRDDYAEYSSLPQWALDSLAKHTSDRRSYVYRLEEFENAATHDPLWNAAQWQLVQEGRMHNYLRMLWGKKILEWTNEPEQAAEIMIELNNKYALDGRNPNSYSGIFWVLGRYDRAWGPERPIFGKVRYMSSENTARKVRVKEYLRRYAPAT